MTYAEFIQNILDTRGRFACGDEYHERHHIKPKCMGGTNDEENLIDLFAREHFEAHRLLALENPNNNSLTYAWGCMSWEKNEYQDRYKLSPEEYEEARIACAKAISENAKKRLANPENNPMYGKHHTEESKAKMREAKLGVFVGENSPYYGKHLSEETRKKISEANKGKNAGENNPMYDIHRYGEDNPFYGKCHTQEAKDKISSYARNRPSEVNIKISISLKGKFTGDKNNNARKVIRLLDLKIYDCLNFAAEDNNMCRSSIYKRCKNHKDFMYYDEWLLEQNNLCLSL